MSLVERFHITPEQASVGLGALRRVIEAGGPVDAREAAFLRDCAEALELGPDWAAHPSVDAARIAAVFPAPAARLVVVQAMIAAACIDMEVSMAAVDCVHEQAAALGVKTRWLATLRHVARRRVMRIRMGLVSSSPDAVRLFRRTWQEERWMGIVRALRFMLRNGLVDPALAWRFRELGLLPEGSLGRTFWNSFTERRLAFPGERGGVPERMLHHDLMHIVNDYGTEPAGECELAGFYTGFTGTQTDDGDPFTFVMIVLTTFHLELRVSPAMVIPARGTFDAARFLRALERGTRLTVDVMGPWDVWALMPLPLPEVRARLGLAMAHDAVSLPGSRPAGSTP